MIALDRERHSVRSSRRAILPFGSSQNLHRLLLSRMPSFSFLVLQHGDPPSSTYTYTGKTCPQLDLQAVLPDRIKGPWARSLAKKRQPGRHFAEQPERAALLPTRQRNVSTTAPKDDIEPEG
uniref:Uncharacterized protein n=1 Tax=Aegilops tauschii subsp. strangulata TaxID=200361 RepID=A0A453NCR6_AEGTS